MSLLIVHVAEQLNAGYGFTSQYNIERLVWYESTRQVLDAIAREKQVKSWRREKKIELIEADNPSWADLARDKACGWR